MNGIDDLVRLTCEWSIERAPNALRIGGIKNGLPARGSAADGAVDVVEEAAAPGAAALVGGHGGVCDVNAPFDMAGCRLGDALAATYVGHWAGVLGGRRRRREGFGGEGGHEEAGRLGDDGVHGGCASF